MAGKAAEKLVVLVGVSEGLLARMYNLTEPNFKRPSSLTSELDRLLKRMLKTFPAHGQDLVKIEGYDIFTKRASEIASELQDFYLTIVSLRGFVEAATTLLGEISSTQRHLSFSENRSMTTLFMTLFTNIVKIFLLANSITDLRLMLTVYAKAHHVVHGNTEPNFLALANFIEKIVNDPLASLREEFEPLVLCIRETLTSLMATLMNIAPGTVLQQRLFAILDHPDKLPVRRDENRHIEILYRARIIEWLLYGFLVCPAVFNAGDENKNAAMMSLFSIAMRAGFVLPIYRERVLPHYELFDKLFDKFKMKKFKLSKSNKQLKEIFKGAQDVAEAHKKLRTYLRSTLHQLHYFFLDFPGLLPPKVWAILGVLNVAREEVLWYFRNAGVTPHKSKKFKVEEFQDPKISELIYYIDVMSRHLLAHEQLVQEHFVEVLKTEDCERATPAGEAVTHASKVSTNMVDLMSNVLSSLRGAEVGDDFEATRLDWLRLSAILTDTGSGSSSASSQSLNPIMNNVLMHTRVVDNLTGLVQEHTSLKLLYFYRSTLMETLKRDLVSAEGQPKCCMAMVRIMSQAVLNVHRMCPEEQRVIGARAVNAADKFLTTICGQMTRLVHGMFESTGKLGAQIEPVEVVNRLKRARAGTKDEQMPGFESMHRSPPHEIPVIRGLRLWRKGVAEICAAIREADTVIVFDTEFVPAEYVHEAVATTLRSTVRRSALPDKSRVQRPSVLLKRIRGAIAAFKTIGENLNINVGEIVRETLFSEFSDLNTGGAGEPLGREIKSSDSSAMILLKAISLWYLNVLGRASDWRITYSELRLGFVTKVDRSDKLPVRAEEFMDINELIALATLAGPYGCRVIERSILSRVARAAKEIRTVLAANQKLLESLRGRFTEPIHWFEMVSQMRGLNELVDHSIAIGCFLKFRALMRRALEHVCQNAVPFIYETVRSVYTQKPEDVVSPALDILANDCGIPISDDDHLLIAALRELKTDAKDAKLWSLLPELYGAAFVSEAYKSTSFMITTASFSNNVHCLSTTITGFVAAFHRIAVDGAEVTNPKQAVRRDLERFIRAAAHTLLHMGGTHKDKFSNYPIQSLILFLEAFVDETNVLQKSLLEEFLPYTVLRTTYLQLYERQTVKGVTFAPVTDADDQQQAQSS